MSYFVWNKIDHAVVRGNDRKGQELRNAVLTEEGLRNARKLTHRQGAARSVTCNRKKRHS
ncbi:Uncharacterised protein [Shewanella baltica]|nr:hypothetical protein TUM4637_38340 [Shewanella hafniensis]VEF25390.1 Uncharacterised protein [Shewanella baltica]